MTPVSVGRLRRRAEFLRVAASGRKAGQPGLVLQVARQAAAVDESGAVGSEPRVGFTCSRKVGGAVERNRAKRRLRAAAAHILPVAAALQNDYVLIGRTETLRRPFALLLQDLRTALKRTGALREPGAGGDIPQGSEGSLQ